MKRFAAILALSASLFSFSAQAVSLPDVGNDFPKGWMEAKIQACTPKPGVNLVWKAYILSLNNGAVERLVIVLSKNGTVHSLTQAEFENGHPKSIVTNMIDGDHLLTFSAAVLGDRERMAEANYRILGVTPEELAKCK